MPAADVFPIPDGVSDARRSRCSLQGLTAWHLYRTSAQLADGRVGRRPLGARAASARSPCSSAGLRRGRVIATASTRGQARSWRSSSAPTPRSTSTREDLADALLRGQRRGSRVDVVLEMAGGARLRRLARRARPVRAARRLRDRLARVQPRSHRAPDASAPRPSSASGSSTASRRPEMARRRAARGPVRAGRAPGSCGSSRARPTRSRRPAARTRTSPAGARPGSSCSTHAAKVLRVDMTTFAELGLSEPLLAGPP